jgi:hypothetical protein
MYPVGETRKENPAALEVSPLFCLSSTYAGGVEILYEPSPVSSSLSIHSSVFPQFVLQPACIPTSIPSSCLPSPSSIQDHLSPLLSYLATITIYITSYSFVTELQIQAEAVLLEFPTRLPRFSQQKCVNTKTRFIIKGRMKRSKSSQRILVSQRPTFCTSSVSNSLRLQ